jgi:hypothetical protein
MDENGGLKFDFIETTWGYARIPKGTIHRFWAEEGQFSAIGNFKGQELPGTNFLPFLAFLADGRLSGLRSLI